MRFLVVLGLLAGCDPPCRHDQIEDARGVCVRESSFACCTCLASNDAAGDVPCLDLERDECIDRRDAEEGITAPRVCFEDLCAAECSTPRSAAP
jgi:hypothetical protein